MEAETNQLNVEIECKSIDLRVHILRQRATLWAEGIPEEDIKEALPLS